MGKSFFEGLFTDLLMFAIIQASKGANGKPNPYKAAGMAYGAMGELSDGEMADLGAMLGAEGAFDD